MPETVLAFDASAAHCAAALLSGDTLLAQIYHPMTRGQAEHLMPLMADMLREAGLTWRDITRIGVGTGPGNFTGIRIAVAAARGLALGLGVPAIGVTSFEAMASGPCRLTIPGPRDQLIWQDFGPDGALAPPAQGAAPPPDGPPARAVDYTALAPAIARLVALRSPGPRPAPLYLRPADAAPARDRAPALLP